MKSIKALGAAVISLALLASLGACGTTDEPSKSGGSGKDSSALSHPTPYDVSGIKKDDAIASLVPQSVAGDGKFKVGMETTYAPGEFVDEDGKTPIGYDVDLSKALAQEMGLKPEMVSASFDSIIPSIGSKYDAGISSFTITKEREQAVDFVTSFKAGTAFAVKKGNPKKLQDSDLCGSKVGVQTGTMEEQGADKLSKECTAKGKKAIDVQSFKLQTDAATAVMTGKIDVFYADSQVTGYAIKQTGRNLEQLGKDSDVVVQGIALKKGDTQMVEATQKAMQKLIDDGTYGKIMDHWGVKSGAVDKAEVNPEVAD
ncbi:Solute-binding protein of ABC transporter system [Bifidobacterium actinocoloniiforme DSM 22766]|uniref:Solute-binding protein of ABC transporter system n=1 Tax=Bifidobacterium actinocoloniiforme DSM 22766 TaxID=1437605 RepID=A0A086Z1C7_9BIFI|nr:ABC transporter substrate-binding protein [Bifidobacterium actinocoloniiforme]AKV55479.1 ABC transporter substrate-binding protein [Bifidobacterium actinocoloniiforme DSM 22766]KFI40327.1 Solute-binding protein of ABC transporter system [Bifidobacterium actinocoloniiforme DSM 22766]